MNKYRYLQRVLAVVFIILLTQMAVRTVTKSIMVFHEYIEETSLSQLSLQIVFQSIMILLIIFSLIMAGFYKKIVQTDISFPIAFVSLMYIAPVTILSYIEAPASFCTIFISFIIIDVLLQILSKRLEQRKEESAARKEKKLRRMKEPLLS